MKFEDITRAIERLKIKCLFCGEQLDPKEYVYEEDPNGFPIEGCKTPFKIYFVCWGCNNWNNLTRLAKAYKSLKAEIYRVNRERVNL